MTARPRPTGIFASNMLVGIGALAAARERGVRVPEDMSIVTLDGEDANYTAPPLTGIALPLDEMGTLAVEELARHDRGARAEGRGRRYRADADPPRLGGAAAWRLRRPYRSADVSV